MVAIQIILSMVLVLVALIYGKIYKKPKLQKQLDFYTLSIIGKCYDLPKNMPVPGKDSIIFIDEKTIKVTNVNYHISDKGNYTVNVIGIINK